MVTKDKSTLPPGIFSSVLLFLATRAIIYVTLNCIPLVNQSSLPSALISGESKYNSVISVPV